MRALAYQNHAVVPSAEERKMGSQTEEGNRQKEWLRIKKNRKKQTRG